jgi:hypothetical protein
MTKRDGRSLEELVSYIESALIPSGFSVETNDKVYDDEGRQIAEFDVLITGKVGTGIFRWLIECRDRPGSGAAPAAWIEQLVGRRDRFKDLNKITAVSTTGFAPGAIEYGRAAGIELREVRALDVESFADWLLIRHIEQIERRAKLDHTTLLLGDSSDEDDLKSLLKALPADVADAEFLKRSVDGQLVRCCNAFAAAASLGPGLFDDIEPNGPEKKVRLRVTYVGEDDHFVVETDRGPLRIAEIVFVGRLSVATSLVPLLETVEYSGALDGEPIAQIARFAPIGSKELRFSIEMRKIAETGETHVVARRVTDEA